MKIVLGGGIGGLSAAYYLSQVVPGSRVAVVEATDRLGGWIKSTVRPLPSGDATCMFEQGPRTIRPVGPRGANTLQLLEELQLSHQVMPVTRSHPAAKRRMIYAHGQLHTLPTSLWQALATTTTPFTKPVLWSALAHDLRTPAVKSPANDESIYTFVARRFGPEIAEYAVSPLICGICAGDATEISVKFLMKTLYDAEQTHGGVVKGMLRNMWAGRKDSKPDITSELVKRARRDKWSVYTLKNGLETLPKTLSHVLSARGVEIRTNATCTAVRFNPDDVTVRINDQDVHCNEIISSVLNKNIATLVEPQHPHLAAELRAIPTVDVAVVNLYYPIGCAALNAFGFLVPPSQNLPILGVIFDSCSLPHYDAATSTCLTVMMGGRWFRQHFGATPTPDHLLDVAVRHVRDILHIAEPPAVHQVTVLPECIPQYVVGHEERVQRICAYIQKHRLPMTLCGASYHGVGVNDVIWSAKHAALGDVL